MVSWTGYLIGETLSMGHLCKFILWCLLIAFCVSTVGCNTVEGLGRDLELAGEALQDAVD